MAIFYKSTPCIFRTSCTVATSTSRAFTPLFTARRVDDATMNIEITTEVPNTYIFYTTDGTAPTRASSVYIGPVNMTRGTHIKILPVYKGEERDSVYEFVIK